MKIEKHAKRKSDSQTQGAWKAKSYKENFTD